MRVTEQDFQTLKSAIAPLDKPEYREQYREGKIARADLVKDIDKRYRWDLYWYAVRLRNNAILSNDCDVEPEALPDSTNGYNDAHIDTALRAIVPAL